MDNSLCHSKVYVFFVLGLSWALRLEAWFNLFSVVGGLPWYSGYKRDIYVGKYN